MASSSKEVPEKSANMASSSKEVPEKSETMASILKEVQEKSENLASTSKEVQKKREILSSISNEIKVKSKNRRLQHEISDSLFSLNEKRTRMPRKLLKTEERLFKRKLSQAEEIEVLQGKGIESLVSTYPLSDPLPEELKMSKESKEMADQSEGLLARVEQLSKQQPEIQKALVERIMKKK